MQKIQSFLWFNDQAEEAANLYLSVFKNSKLISKMPGPGGTVMGVTVELDGREFIPFNGGPHYKPNQSISFMVNCMTEEEIGGIWNKLSDGGKVMMELNTYPWSDKYGWIEDKFGISWQLTLSRIEKPITPTFLFCGAQQGKAEEALNLYTSLFPNSSISLIARYEPGEPGPEGQIKFSAFTIEDLDFSAMDSGRPMDVPFTPGISMFVNCQTQEEVDMYWEKLSENGHKDRCGWLQDKFGVAWQIIPTALGKLLADKDREKAQRVMQAMLAMTKIDIAGLQNAYDGK